MRSGKKRLALLCLLLVGGGGWIVLPNVDFRVGESLALASHEAGAAAADPAPPSGPAAGNPSSLWGDSKPAVAPSLGLGNSELFLKMMLSVGLVLGLGGAALYLSRRVLPRVTKPGGRQIRVLETSFLGPRKALHLVEVDGRRLLLASTSDRVTLLAGLSGVVDRGDDLFAVDETWPDRPGQDLQKAVKT